MTCCNVTFIIDCFIAQLLEYTVGGDIITAVKSEKCYSWRIAVRTGFRAPLFSACVSRHGHESPHVL